MSIYDVGEEMKDKAREASNKLYKAIGMLSDISGDDEVEDILATIDEVKDILDAVNCEIY